MILNVPPCCWVTERKTNKKGCQALHLLAELGNLGTQQLFDIFSHLQGLCEIYSTFSWCAGRVLQRNIESMNGLGIVDTVISWATFGNFKMTIYLRCQKQIKITVPETKRSLSSDTSMNEHVCVSNFIFQVEVRSQLPNCQASQTVNVAAIYRTNVVCLCTANQNVSRMCPNPNRVGTSYWCLGVHLNSELD